MKLTKNQRELLAQAGCFGIHVSRKKPDHGLNRTVFSLEKRGLIVCAEKTRARVGYVMTGDGYEVIHGPGRTLEEP